MTVEYRDETPFKGDNHTPTELANAIRTKKYGKDVREPIAQLADKLSNAVLGQNIGSVVATPTKVFTNLNELKKTYPNGADGVMVTADSGHKYFWQDNQWVDFGIYQSQGQGSKAIKSSDVLQSKINYDSISAWNNATFTINSDSSITVDDSSVYNDRGIIFPLSSVANYFNLKIINDLESGTNVDVWNYDPKSSNSVGKKISDINHNTNEIQTLNIPSGCDRIMVAVHGRGNFRIKASASNYRTIDLDDFISFETESMDVANLIDNKARGTEMPLNAIGSFGNTTMTNYSDGIVANVNSNNGGILTKYFSATSEKVKINLEGNFTQKGVTVQINYVDTITGKDRYFKVANISGGKLQGVTFDASSLIIYQHADKDKFKVLIQSNVDSADNNNPVGQITLTSMYIKDGASQSDLYNYRLKSTLLNLIDKLSNLEGDVNAIKADNSAYVTMPDGTKGRIIYANGQLTVKSNIYKKILLLGNSLLLGSSTDGSHGAPFGLTASSPTKDWAYLLTQKLQAKYSDSVVVNKLHDAVFEQSESNDNSQNYINNNFSKAEKNNDLVIIQIGDNVNSDLRRTTLKANFEKLINAIRSANPTADILIAGVWFDGGGLQNWLLDFANSHGCMFAPLHDLYKSDTIATVGDTITFADGTQMQVYEAIKTHPGDKGHALIADRVFSTLYPN